MLLGHSRARCFDGRLCWLETGRARARLLWWGGRYAAGLVRGRGAGREGGEEGDGLLSGVCFSFLFDGTGWGFFSSMLLKAVVRQAGRL